MGLMRSIAPSGVKAMRAGNKIARSLPFHAQILNALPGVWLLLILAEVTPETICNSISAAGPQGEHKEQAYTKVKPLLHQIHSTILRWKFTGIVVPAPVERVANMP